MSSPLRIAMIGQRGVPATFGGIEHHVEELGSRLAAMGHEVTVFCRTTYVEERLSSHRGMRLRHLPTIDSKHLDALVHSGVSSLATVGGRYDVVHYHALGPGLFSPLPRFLSRAKVVQTIHGLDDERAKWGLAARTVLRTAGWLSARVPDATVVVSRALGEHYAQVRGRATTHIPNGVKPATPRPPKRITERWGLQGEDYVLFVGRLVPEKAPDVLIRAFRDVPGDTRLVIAGGSSHTDSYVEQLQALAAADPRVVLAGYVYGDDLAELYTNAAVFTLPSRLEGLPLTLLEAASYELPVVASSIPPHVEVLGTTRPGGRLVEPGSIPQLTAALATSLVERAAEREGGRALSQAVLPVYDWDAAAERTAALYASLVGR
jgi:glycosyltransferase involved in cell wall biosynthesis